MKDFFSRNRESDQYVYPERFERDERFSLLERVYHEWARNEPQPDVEKFYRFLALNRTSGLSLRDPDSGHNIGSDTIERYLTRYIASYVHYSVAWHRRLPSHYGEFAKSLKRRGFRYAILTFNYDMVFERAIIREIGGVDYRLGALRGMKEFSDRFGTPLIKLHGSLNWLKCTKCGKIAVHDRPVAHKFKRERCGSRCSGFLEPVIVPPVRNKEAYLGSGNVLWNEALRTLMKADNLVILGYSLPTIDETAEEMLKHAIRSNDRLTVDIVNPDLATIDSIGKRLGYDGLEVGGYPGYVVIPSNFKEYVAHLIQ